MKKVCLIVLLIGIAIIEIYLFTALLPQKWQIALGHAVGLRLPPGHDQSLITHPALDQEIDQALRENVALRVTFYAFLVLLLAGNTVLLVWVTRLVRCATRERRSQGTRSP